MTTAIAFVVLSLVGCGEKQEERSVSGMKCGAGKCGANMFDGNAALAKKKRNILSQMRDDDSRKTCVLEAKTTKVLYACIRDPKSNKLTTKCGSNKCGESMDQTVQESMKCGAGKCGVTTPEIADKPTMKCGAGKCGAM